MKITRNYITPFISLAFLVVGITGVLMMSHGHCVRSSY